MPPVLHAYYNTKSLFHAPSSERLSCVAQSLGPAVRLCAVLGGPFQGAMVCPKEIDTTLVRVHI